MKFRSAPLARRGTVAVAFALLAGACENIPGGNLILGPAPAPIAGPPRTPDARGVISYPTHQVAVALDGDTVASVAGRLGIGAEALARLNGLPPDTRLRRGDLLALPGGMPPSGPGLPAPGGWSPEIAAAAIESAPGSVAPDNPFGNGQSDPLIDPIRHRVEPGETAYSIARLYGVSVTALSSWNGLGPDLAVREGQELMIPIVSGANQIASASTADSLPGQATPVAPPPIAATPLPENIETDVTLASPDLGQYRTPPGGRLQPPVNGPVTKEYAPGTSEGIGYSVPAGTPVRAAGDGEVALVSESIGGLGTIVLVRHNDDLMTVYGRVSDVAVERGQRIAAGQTIGVVAERDDPELHFEVRRGTESVDPTTYLGG